MEVCLCVSSKLSGFVKCLEKLFCEQHKGFLDADDLFSCTQKKHSTVAASKSLQHLFSFVPILKGVPLGCVLGPLLFTCVNNLLL